MAFYRKRGENWYYTFVDQDGRKRERKGCSNRRATEDLARAAESEAAKVKAGLADPKDFALKRHESRPITEHLRDWQASIEAGGNTRMHALVTSNRARKLFAMAKVNRISGITMSRVAEALGMLRADGFATETINHFIRAGKMFARWLWRDGRAREHLLAHLKTSSSESDRRKVHRALSDDEAARLITAAETGPVVMGMTGADRAACYKVALGTGFRLQELASLSRESFSLDTDPPTITCKASNTKNGSPAFQPIPRALADQLKLWLAQKPPEAKVFPLSRKAADMMKADLRRANLEFETADGIAGFHALRVTYISNIVATGTNVRVAMTLARHSTPVLTLKVYAKARLHDVEGAVDALPTFQAPEPQTAAATGTDGQPIKKLLADHLPTRRDGTGRFLVGPDGRAHAEPPTDDGPQTLEIKGPDTF